MAKPAPRMTSGPCSTVSGHGSPSVPRWRPSSLEGAQDAWKRVLRVGVSEPTLVLWTVKSAGEDGTFGTDDDIDEGNAADLRAYFTRNRANFRIPTKREFEVVSVMLPLLDDAVLRALWEAYPDQRPKTEQALFEHWNLYRGEGLFYRAAKPGDEQTGHGVEAMQKLAPKRSVHPVPSADVFPVLAQAESTDDEGSDDEPKDEDPEAGDDAPLPPVAGEDDEALRKQFAESGWRSVVARDMLVEAILNDALRRARESAAAVAAWDAQYGRFGNGEKSGGEKNGDGKDGDDNDENDDDEGGDGEEKPAIPERPTEVTFEQIVADELSRFQVDGHPVFVHWKTEAPMTEEAWRKDPLLDDAQLRLNLNPLSGTGQYANIPVQLHGLTVKAIVRNIEVHPSRQPELDEVREAVFGAYLKSRQMDHATDALTALQDAAERPTDADEGEDEQARRLSRWPKVLAQWQAKYPEALSERTGMFIGRRPPSPVRVEEPGAEEPTDPEVERIKRRNYVWRRGYSTVQPSPSKQDELVAKPGVFGRTVLADREGTGRAYLVRVAAQAFPSEEEFSPRRYAEFMRLRAFGPMRAPSRIRRPVADQPGRYSQAAGRFLDDIEFMSSTFNLRTTTNLDLLPE